MTSAPANDASGRERASVFALAVPLVRTDGKSYTNGLLWDTATLVNDPVLRRDMRDTTARETETICGLPASLYLYVGHACPDFGADGNTLVFVFASDTFDAEPEGSMTPFDTGGLEKHIHFDDRPDDLRAYVEEHLIRDLSTWRVRFCAYIDEYFESAAAYVRGDRAKDSARRHDRDGRHFHSENERRAWTWELQLYRDHDVRKGLVRLWLPQHYRVFLESKVRNLPKTEKQLWKKALKDCIRVPDVRAPHESNAKSICSAAENDVIHTWLQQ